MPSNTSLERNQSLRPCYGLAALGRGDRLVTWVFERRELRTDDIAVKIQFCGVCHSDLHAIRGSGPFPLVPGHEFVGEVTAITVSARGKADAGPTPCRVMLWPLVVST